jgi:hypothetical protein
MASATTKSYPSNQPISGSDLQNLWINAGGSKTWAPVMAAIALAESEGGYPGALAGPVLLPGADPNHWTNTNGEDSRGLWQINVRAHPEYANVNLFDPTTNAQAAVAVFNSNGGPGPWSTYTNGAYKSHLAEVGVTTVPPGNNGTGATVPSGLPPSGPWSGLTPAQQRTIANSLLNGSLSGSQLQALYPGAPAANNGALGGLIPSGVTSFLSDPFGIGKDFSNIGKDILYAAIILGGGLLMLTGIVLVGADLGLSAFAAARRTPGVKQVTEVVDTRNTKRAATQAASSTARKQAASERAAAHREAVQRTRLRAARADVKYKERRTPKTKATRRIDAGTDSDKAAERAAPRISSREARERAQFGF